MSYLYDKRGEPDDDLKALEDRLASARLSPPAVSWERQATRRPRLRWAALALAAGLGAAAVLLPHGPSFTVTTASGSSRLSVGRWLETTESADITVADIGHVTVEPSSRVRLVETSKQRHRLELERGALHAKVAAPPRLFVVDTPAAQAVDLGCEYRLSVEPSGATRLEVLKGEVSLEGHGASSRVSAGAVCVTKKGEAPGVPRSVKSAAAFGQALDAWESHQGGLEPVLATAGRDDAVSLWNLLPRVDEPQRAQVVDKLKGVIEQPPKDVPDADVVKLRAPAMESLWQSFP
jgi:ferric-dicitrate binding protein FerR (iron transport regulator)